MTTLQRLDWSIAIGSGRISYRDAERAVANLGSEWRIPSEDEWKAAMRDPEGLPELEAGWYWTSTAYRGPRSSQMVVVNPKFRSIGDSARNELCHLRAVRPAVARTPAAPRRRFAW